MRLIDADKLVKEIHDEWDRVQVWDETGDATALEIERLVDAQPTITPWRYPAKGEMPKYDVLVLCLQSDKEIPFIGRYDAILGWYNWWGKHKSEPYAWQYIELPQDKA